MEKSCYREQALEEELQIGVVGVKRRVLVMSRKSCSLVLYSLQQSSRRSYFYLCRSKKISLLLRTI
jgi:hypothetical protein